MLLKTIKEKKIRENLMKKVEEMIRETRSRVKVGGEEEECF